MVFLHLWVGGESRQAQKEKGAHIYQLAYTFKWAIILDFVSEGSMFVWTQVDTPHFTTFINKLQQKLEEKHFGSYNFWQHKNL